jgi:hypothetical protein
MYYTLILQAPATPVARRGCGQKIPLPAPVGCRRAQVGKRGKIIYCAKPPMSMIKSFWQDNSTLGKMTTGQYQQFSVSRISIHKIRILVFGTDFNRRLFRSSLTAFTFRFSNVL